MHAGEKMIDLPDEVLARMADGNRTETAPTPFERPKGKQLSELSDSELMTLASQSPKGAA